MMKKPQKPKSKTAMVRKDLIKLADRINEQHQLCRQTLRMTLEHAVMAGELLENVKSEIGHGKFGQWIAENCTFSPRTAQFYMKVSRNRKKLKNESISHLSLSGAIKLLRQPKQEPKPSKEREDLWGKSTSTMGQIFRKYPSWLSAPALLLQMAGHPIDEIARQCGVTPGLVARALNPTPPAGWYENADDEEHSDDMEYCFDFYWIEAYTTAACLARQRGYPELEASLRAESDYFQKKFMGELPPIIG